MSTSNSSSYYPDDKTIYMPGHCSGTHDYYQPVAFFGLPTSSKIGAPLYYCVVQEVSTENTNRPTFNHSQIKAMQSNEVVKQNIMRYKSGDIHYRLGLDYEMDEFIVSKRTMVLDFVGKIVAKMHTIFPVVPTLYYIDQLFKWIETSTERDETQSDVMLTYIGGSRQLSPIQEMMHLVVDALIQPSPAEIAFHRFFSRDGKDDIRHTNTVHVEKLLRPDGLRALFITSHLDMYDDIISTDRKSSFLQFYKDFCRRNLTHVPTNACYRLARAFDTVDLSRVLPAFIDVTTVPFPAGIHNLIGQPDPSREWTGFGIRRGLTDTVDAMVGGEKKVVSVGTKKEVSAIIKDKMVEACIVDDMSIVRNMLLHWVQALLERRQRVDEFLVQTERNYKYFMETMTDIWNTYTSGKRALFDFPSSFPPFAPVTDRLPAHIEPRALQPSQKHNLLAEMAKIDELVQQGIVVEVGRVSGMPISMLSHVLSGY